MHIICIEIFERIRKLTGCEVAESVSMVLHIVPTETGVRIAMRSRLLSCLRELFCMWPCRVLEESSAGLQSEALSTNIAHSLG